MSGSLFTCVSLESLKLDSFHFNPKTHLCVSLSFSLFQWTSGNSLYTSCNWTMVSVLLVYPVCSRSFLPFTATREEPTVNFRRISLFLLTHPVFSLNLFRPFFLTSLPLPFNFHKLTSSATVKLYNRHKTKKSIIKQVKFECIETSSQTSFSLQK